MDDHYLIRMGERVTTGRNILKYTQEQTAALAKVTRQTIQTVEKGQTELKAKSISGIANALEMSTDYLLNGKRSEYDLHLIDKRALSLTEEQFDFLKKICYEFIEFCESNS